MCTAEDVRHRLPGGKANGHADHAKGGDDGRDIVPQRIQDDDAGDGDDGDVGDPADDGNQFVVQPRFGLFDVAQHTGVDQPVRQPDRDPGDGHDDRGLD